MPKGPDGQKRLGDEIAYVIEEDRAILTKAPSTAVGDSFATFNEWDEAADRKAYKGL
jgi:antitoxin PrlF